MKNRQKKRVQKVDHKLIGGEQTPSIEIGIFGIKGVGKKGVQAAVLVIALLLAANFFGVGPLQRILM